MARDTDKGRFGAPWDIAAALDCSSRRRCASTPTAPPRAGPRHVGLPAGGLTCALACYRPDRPMAGPDRRPSVGPTLGTDQIITGAMHEDGLAGHRGRSVGWLGTKPSPENHERQPHGGSTGAGFDLGLGLLAGPHLDRPRRALASGLQRLCSAAPRWSPSWPTCPTREDGLPQSVDAQTKPP
jgi:hypothetical protein